MKILKKDIRKLNLPKESIDVVISSPPYFNTLDYVNSHRLRLAVMGIYKKEDTQQLKKLTIQSKPTYLNEMEKVINSISKVLKPNGVCCFVLGDIFQGSKVINTADLIKDIFLKFDFKHLATIEDKIPPNKSVQKGLSIPNQIGF